MLIDARDIEPGTVLEADVCVVGAGAAGITIARALAASSRSVLVLESGGFEGDADTHRLTEGDVVGHYYQPLASTRIRAFGGTTGHWNGQCRPLDPIDFEVRPGVPDSGWPFGPEELEPWYPLAHDVLQLGPPEYDPAWWNTRYHTGEALPFPTDGPIETVMWQLSPPTRFGLVYRDELVRAPRVTLCLHANVVDIETTNNGARVTALDVATLTGRRFRVRAGAVALAAGALENTRLLLSSTGAHPDGLGNGNGLVGRYFTDHPHLTAGPVVLASPPEALGLYNLQIARLTSEAGARRPDHDQGLLGGLALRPDVRRRRGLLGFSATLHPPAPFPLPGFRPLADLARDTAPLAGDVRQAAGTTVATLMLRCEQAPNHDSRVTLGEQRDELGLRRLQLDWRLTELDATSTTRAVALLSSYLGSAGLGVARVDPPAGEFLAPARGGPHQLGTLRMSDDPRRGVVDANCRVHGVENLFVAGGAVFPSGGYANPTLTIVALALRLTDHLQRELA